MSPTMFWMTRPASRFDGFPIRSSISAIMTSLGRIPCSTAVLQALMAWRTGWRKFVGTSKAMVTTSKW